VSPGSFTQRSTSRSKINVTGMDRIVGRTGPKAVRIGGANRVQRVPRSGSGGHGIVPSA
jgi:hypothetical protein